MLSFEKVLRETEGINYGTDRSGDFKIEWVNGLRKSVRSYPDDPFRSVGALLVGKIRSLFPQYSEYPSIPLNGVGVGINIDSFLSDGKHQALYDLVSTRRDLFAGEEYESTIDQFIRSVSGGIDQFSKFQIVELGHRIAVGIRNNPPIFDAVGQDCPFATTAELGLVCFGKLRRSVKDVPAYLIGGLQQCYPDGFMRGPDFILNDPRTVLDELSWPPTPELDMNMFTEQSLTEAALSVPESISLPEDLLSLGVEHVVMYACVDVNRLTQESKRHALFGSDLGMEVWERKIPQNAKRTISSKVNRGPVSGMVAIDSLTQLLKKHAPSVDDRTLILLAAGRFVSWKGQWDLSSADSWIKRN